MKQGRFTIVRNNKVANNTYYLEFEGENPKFSSPGQFFNISLPECFLRRPFSVCSFTKSSFSAYYKTVGKGTQMLSSLPCGTCFDVLCGLGNGFDLNTAGERPLLVGGGTGASPLFGLAEALIAAGVSPVAVLGFSTADDAFLISEFESLGIEIIVATDDGSLGTFGNAVSALPKDYSYVYSCGPLPMMRALCEKSKTGGQYSLEARLGCGFGACMGCSIETKNGSRRVCKDGPVFYSEDLLWQTLR
ncbi:MAG: dihydroorotate dehydrogenase electron transfer subunit [Ruminococcaceae bacterium]|nr:dihydroorotate dehydrogenase electron transfer subunit [Oscillospiraceae bacterium]